MNLMRYSYEKIYFNTYDDLDGIWFAGSDYQGDYSGKEWRTEGTAVTTVRGNKSVTVYKDKYGKITGRSESTTNSQGKTHTVYRDQYGQRTGTSTTSIKNSGTSSTTTTVYRDKYGQRTGTSTTRQTGNSSTTTYKDKYGRIQKRGNSQRK
nr:hypothetical protein [uncultured Prevotella sp.]